MGGACCKAVVVELNPDGTPKDPQDVQQMKSDPGELRIAAKQADWAQMRTLLRRMPSNQINSKVPKAENPEEEGYTALHYSVSINHLKGVQKLVRYTHSVHTKNRDGKTPLHFALESSKLKVASFLMSKGADINATDNQGGSPLLNVIASGRRKLADWIVQECQKHDQLVDWGLMDSRGNSAALYAAKYGWHELLKEWVMHSEKCVNVQNADGETILGWVLKFAASDLLPKADATELTKTLISCNARLDLPAFEEKVPPICLAAAANHMELFNAVVEAGGVPQTQIDALGRNALHYAAAKGAKSTADALMGMGLLPYALDKQRNTPMHLAALSGTTEAIDLVLDMLDKAADKRAALLTPNKDGFTVYHMALKAGNGEAAQKLSLALIDTLHAMQLHSTEVCLKPGVIIDTPLLLAVEGHQDKVVKKLIELGVDVNQTNHKGVLPLSRNLSSISALTFDADAAIFDTLINAGSVTEAASPDDHPVLAICKNSLSNFTERAVKVLKDKGQLDWDKKDNRGYTPLMLAAFHNNVWLVRYLIDEVHVSPNDPSQRTRPGAPQVIGKTGGCCSKAIMSAGTVGNQTPLMCAAKGASLGALKILVQRGADVHAVDSAGNNALAYAMTMDKIETLDCARVLLAAGSKTTTPGPKWESKGPPVQILDITGESWVHRAVRFGAAWFVEVWARHQGCLEVLATTPEDADTMPDGSLPEERKKDIIDSVPTLPEAEEEQDDEVVIMEDDGEDSEAEEAEQAEQAEQAEEAEEEGGGRNSGPVAEGVASAGLSIQELVAKGLAQTFYPGPSDRQLKRWRRQGGTWWSNFWVDKEHDLPPADFEPDLFLEDTYNACDVGEDEIDYEDVLDLIRDQEAQVANSALPCGNALRAVRTQKLSFSGGGGLDASFTDASPRQADQLPSSGGSNREGLLSGMAKRLLDKSLSRGSSPRINNGGPSAVAEGVSRPSFRPQSTGGFAIKELDGVSSPVRRASLTEQQASVNAANIENQINHLAYRAARQLGLSPEVMAAYGMDVLEIEEEEKRLWGSGSDAGGPVAESKVYPEPEVKSITIKQSAADRAKSLVQGTPGEKLWANEPYYQPDTRYQGVPKYMDEATWPWWPKVDCADQMPGGKDCYPPYVRAKMNEDIDVEKSSKWLTDPEGLWNVPARLKSYKSKKEKVLAGAALRVRNLEWYLKSMSPPEFPLKAGQWSSVQKKLPKAIAEARKLAPRRPGEKVKIRQKKVWFGIPDLPCRPELFETTPLLMAVRLGRISCMQALLKLSNSVNIPDGFGLTPIQYAMLMLFKEKTNSTLQQIADLLLEKRPLISARPINDMYMWPRAKQAADSISPNAPKAAIQAVKLRKMMTDPATFNPSDHPTVMDPLILGTLANDMQRVAWMVFCCGANLNESVVSMQEIPIYLNGLFDKMCSKTQSKVNPLHVAILHKNHATVRLLLDMGADPNTYGREYSGDMKRDLKRKAKLMKEKMAKVEEFQKESAKSNPMERVWRVPSIGIKKLFGMMKSFISSIELPGLSRPHPWVSALHLSCRLGQAPITFLLLKRGAAPNGSGAAAFAPKSPLEEALAYARDNCQSFNIGLMGDGRPNYKDVRRMARLDESIPEAIATQQEKLGQYEQQLREKAEKVASKRRESDSKVTADSVYSEALRKANVSLSTLALFGLDDLKEISVPNMNPVAQAAALGKAMMAAMSALYDPTKMAMKAAALAAKMVVKILLEMMKRPIAHWDPALACAHVMFYHRAPYNANHKGTSIVLRDMIDHGTYAWMALDEGLVADGVWKPTAVNRIVALKTNHVYGYKKLDMTIDPKEYKKSLNKFNDAVETSYYNTAINQLGAAYNLPTLVEHLEGRDKSGQPKPVSSLSHLNDRVKELMSKALMSEMVMVQQKVLDLCLTLKKNPALGADPDYVASKFPGVPQSELKEMKAWGDGQVMKLGRLEAAMKLSKEEAKGGSKGWRNAAEVEALLPGVSSSDLEALKSECQAFLSQGKTTPKSALISTWPLQLDALDAAFATRALKSAQSKLPAWYAELSPHGSVQDCVDDIAKRFSGFNVEEQAVKEFEGMPQVNDSSQSMNPFDVLLEGDELDYSEPAFPEKSLSKLARSTDHLAVSDVVKAVQTSYIQIEAQMMREEQAMRAECMMSLMTKASAARVEQVKAMVQARSEMMKEQAEKLKNFELMDWSDEDVIDAAMNKVNFEIAAAKLGPRGKMVAKMLDGQLTPEQLAELMSGGFDQAAEKLKDKMESMLPEGVSLDECNMDDLRSAAENVDFEAMLEDGVDALADQAMNSLGKSKAAKQLAALDARMSANPVLGELYKNMKEQLGESAKEALEQIPDLSNPEALLPDFMQDPSFPSLADLESSLEDMTDMMSAAFEDLNFDTLHETVLGLELDMAADMEAIIEAITQARDALVTILDILDMDVM